MNVTQDKAYPWLLLFGRTLLALGVQALFAFGAYVNGATGVWEASAAWWPLGVDAGESYLSGDNGDTGA